MAKGRRCFFLLVLLWGTGSPAFLKVDPAIQPAGDGHAVEEKLKVTLLTNGDTLDITLKKNSGVDVNAPLYIAGKDGETTRAIVKNITNVGMYTDVKTTANFKATFHDIYGAGIVVIFEGSVAFKNKEWTLKPDPNYKLDPSQVITYEMTEARRPDFGTDYVPNPTTSTTPSTPVTTLMPSSRRKRATLTAVNIDVLVVVDYAIYSEFFSRSNLTTDQLKREDALAEIRKYFAHIMNGVALRYDDISRDDVNPPIVVRLVGYVVAETAFDDVWIQPYKVLDPGSGWFTADADSVLDALEKWRKGASVPANDHAMLFTRYDLTVVNDGKVSKGVVGYAPLGALCTGKSISVIEEYFDRFDGTSATAAHELGHSLGAEHDGTDNICGDNENFLMWPSVTSNNIYHVWNFSHCSIDYFNFYINSLAEKQYGKSCLETALEPDTLVFDVGDTVHGQNLTVTEQCELAQGSGSYICMSLVPMSTFCGKMYCWIPGTGYCSYVYPALGTQCGSHKWCLGGQCIHTDHPSISNESCLLGEETDVSGTGLSCPEYLDQYGGYSCYDSSVLSKCCTSCQTFATNTPGCEFGNRASVCLEKYCGENHTWSDGSTYEEKCCLTCNDEDALSTPISVNRTLSTPISINLTLSTPISVGVTLPTLLGNITLPDNSGQLTGGDGFVMVISLVICISDVTTLLSGVTQLTDILW